MSFELLPTPRVAELGTDRIAIGPASPLSLPGKADPAVRGLLRAVLKTGGGRTPLALRHDPTLAPEGCRLTLSPADVDLAAPDAAGWRHGLDRLQQLTRRGTLPVGRIDDAPSLSMRGYHVDFNIATLGVSEALRLLDAMARWRLNTVLLEYERRYPYRTIAAQPSDGRLTRGQVRELVAHARSLGITVIPLQQCLGHVDYVLADKTHARLREENMRRDQWCPLKPGSLTLFKRLVDDMVELHPGIRYFHIGGDEARRLGACPRCARVARLHGKGRLYVDFVTRAAEYVLSLGLTPIVWDDMLCAHSEVIEQMPREVVIMYWDYWTTRDPSALFVARPEGGLGVVADRNWRDRWQAELGETEQRTVARFARPMDLGRDLSPAFRARFSRYLGPEFPRRVRAFPYLEYYQDLGFRVIGAPTGGGNTSAWHGLPDFPRYGDNIRTFCRRLYEAGALGVMTTAWYTMPPEALFHGLVCTGQFAWNVTAGGN